MAPSNNPPAGYPYRDATGAYYKKVPVAGGQWYDYADGSRTYVQNLPTVSGAIPGMVTSDQVALQNNVATAQPTIPTPPVGSFPTSSSYPTSDPAKAAGIPGIPVAPNGWGNSTGDVAPDPAKIVVSAGEQHNTDPTHINDGHQK